MNKLIKIVGLSILMMGSALHAMDAGHSAPDQWLLRAISEKDIEGVKASIFFGANVTVRNNVDRTVLMMATLLDDHDVCQILIAKGADVNAHDSLGQTALHIAALTGRYRICELLVENGADLNPKRGISNTALTQAAIHGHDAICKLLIEKGADVDLNVCGTMSAQLLIQEMIRPSKKEIDSIVGLIGSFKRMPTTLLNQDMKKLTPRMLFADIKQQNKAKARTKIMEVRALEFRAELLGYLKLFN